MKSDKPFCNPHIDSLLLFIKEGSLQKVSRYLQVLSVSRIAQIDEDLEHTIPGESGYELLELLKTRSDDPEWDEVIRRLDFKNSYTLNDDGEYEYTGT